MARPTVVFSILIVALLAVTGLSGADRKDSGPRGRGRLPPSWSKLGLTDEQKQQIYAVQDQYQTKIEGLEQQLRELRKQQRTDMGKILTPAQKARLREILAEKAPSDKPDDKDNKDNKKSPLRSAPDKDK